MDDGIFVFSFSLVLFLPYLFGFSVHLGASNGLLRIVISGVFFCFGDKFGLVRLRF